MFPGYRCAKSLVYEPWVARAGRTSWPVSLNQSVDGSGCAIGPNVTYDRCFSLVPPTTKSVGAVVSFALLPAVVEATVEVGLSPHAGREGSAEFELRLVTQMGDVVASDVIVRSRRGTKIPPAVLHVSLPKDVRGASETVLQLAVNDEDGDATEDFVVWANPMFYCDDGCDVCGSRITTNSAEDDEQTGASLRESNAIGDGHGDWYWTSLLMVALLVAMALCLQARHSSKAVGRLRTGPRASSGTQSTVRSGRVIGDVNIMRRNKPDDGEKLNLMGAVDEDEGDEVHTIL